MDGGMKDPFYEELRREIDRDFWITLAVIVVGFIPLLLAALRGG